MVVLAATAAALLALCHALWIIPRLPEPADHPSDEPPKVAFRELNSRGRLVGLFVGCFALGQVMWLTPSASWLAWVSYLGGGGALIYVDLFTTYLPARLHYLVASELAVGLLWWASQSGWSMLIWPLIGGGLCSGLLWLFWRFAGGIGFGDVRLVQLSGAIAATSAVQLAFSSLLVGSVLGAIWGIAHQLTRRFTGKPSFFPYGPALWLGPVGAVGLATLTG